MKNFTCKNCGSSIQPPEILPPMILNGTASGEFRIKISFPCGKCQMKQQTNYQGEVKLSEIIVKTCEIEK